MRVFVTGATGFIGSAIVTELLDEGHQVLGLARSDASAEALARTGATVHRGDLEDVESLAAGARACDGVIHTAFIHDFSRHLQNAEADRRALAAMADVLAGSGRPLVAASGTALLAPGRTATEQDSPPDPNGPRAASEELLVASAERGVRSVIVRLPPTVHGAGDHGFVPWLIDIARRTDVAAFVGDGANRWPAVHRLDAARLFRLGLEKAVPGTRLHAVAEPGIPMRDIAGAIGQGLGVPVKSVGHDEAAAHFEFLARFVAVDNPTSSEWTRRAIDWQPSAAGLLDDMREAGYFG